MILLAGIVDIAGCIFFYKALNTGEVSRIVPFVGSFVAIFILILSFLFIGEHLSTQQFFAFILLVSGSLILSYLPRRQAGGENNFFQKPFGVALLSALLFAIYWVITKYIFLNTTFVNGVIWIRTGVAIIALFLLLPRKNRQLIFRETKELKPKTIGFFTAGRAFDVVGAFFLYLAVFLGSVTLTNSLQGLQYAFVLVLALLFFKKFPVCRKNSAKRFLPEKLSPLF